MSTRRSLYPWYVTGVLALTHLVSLVDRNLLGVVLVDVKRELALTDTQLGLLYGTGFALIYSVITLPLGRLADRSNRKNLIAAGLLFWTMATAATALVQSFGVIFALRLAVGLGEACLVPAGMSLLMSLVPKPVLARATAVFATGGGQGRTVALLGGGPLLTTLTVAGGLTIPWLGLSLTPWRATFLLASLPGLVLVPLILLLREPARAVTSGAHSGDSLGTVLRGLRVRAGAYALHFGTFTAAATMVWALSAWTLSILIREEGMSAAQAGSILGLVALTTGPAGNFLGGWILDRMDARNASAAPAVIMSASLAVSVPFVLIFSVPHDLVTSIVGYTLLQLVLACANSPGWVGVQHLTPPQHRGVATALFVATYTSISLGVGPVIVGLMSDFVFHGENALSRSLMVTLLVLAAGGAAAGVLARAPYARAMAHESPQTGVTADLQSGCKAH